MSSDKPSEQISLNNIKGVECVPEDVIYQNMLRNMETIPDWAGIYHAMTRSLRPALIVSAGNSVRKDPKLITDAIEKMTQESQKPFIVAVKHSLSLLKDLGVEPDMCVILDPRPIEEKSTHGYTRKDLLVPFKNTRYLIASMSAFGYAEYLLEKGCKVIGWHTACSSSRRPDIADRVQQWVDGGSCATVRAISLLSSFGFRRIGLIGVDCTLDEAQQQATLDKGEDVVKITMDGVKYYTTKELAVQIKDFLTLFQQNQDIVFEVLDEVGACRAAFDHVSKNAVNPVNPPEFFEVFNSWGG